MKDTKRPQWIDEAPRWESSEVHHHYDSQKGALDSPFLDSIIPLAEARDRRANGEPLEYLLRHCHTDSFTLKCDSRALIPRVETETLVRRFISRLDKLPPGKLVDCGTGTGFIAGWMAEHTNRNILATERSASAIRLARENCVLNNWDFSLTRTDRLRGVQGPFAAILANLPYVLPGSRRVDETVLDYEPREALVVPEDPVEFYGSFLEDALRKLRPGGELWMEGAWPIFEILVDSVLPSTGASRRSLKKDNRGFERFLVLVK